MRTFCVFDDAPGSASTHQPPDEIAAIIMDRECEDLVTAYYEIPNTQLRQTFLSLLRTISRTSNVPIQTVEISPSTPYKAFRAMTVIVRGARRRC